MKVQGIVALAVVAVAIAACGGGGGGGGSVPSGSVAVVPTSAANATPTPGTLPANYAVDKVTLSMPKGTYATITSTVRQVQTVGANTESIVFTLLQQNGVTTTGTAQPFGLYNGSVYCTANATTGALSCVLPVDAPIGQDIFLAQTYDGPNGSGNLTGSGAVALSVGQNTTNTASITLSAQVASVYVVAGTSYLGVPDSLVARHGAQASSRIRSPQAAHTQQATITSLPVYVVAVDSSGNTILNPSAYNAPIYLQMAFDLNCGINSCYDGQYGTADVTLTATYGINDPSPCTGGSASISSWYASLPLCSPSDSVVASLSTNGGTNPSDEAEIYGYITSNLLLPTPAPGQSPTPLPTPSANSFAEIEVYPTPVSTGNLPVIAQ